MTVQMREGWVVEADGGVRFYEQEEFFYKYPWVCKETGHNVLYDGTCCFSGCNYGVTELLDPWDPRVPEGHREKRFVSGQYVRSQGELRPCVFDRKTEMCAPFKDDFWAVLTAEMLNRGTDHEGYIWFQREFVPSHDTGSIAEQGEPVIEQPTSDPVNHPTHYTQHPSGVECIQVTQHMNFCLGNAVKYIWRADLKHDAIEDLKKAAWYINREIERREGK